jgi:hypothetical protein
MEKRESYVHRSIDLVHSILLDLWKFVLTKGPDMKKIGKILNLYALIKVR